MTLKAGWKQISGMAAALALAGPAWADTYNTTKDPQLTPPPVTGAPSLETLNLAEDSVSRLTVPVMINGQGPFPFVIDTGADRTVISRELATQLKLPPGPRAELHGAAGVVDVDTAVISSLEVGSRTVERISAPLLAARDLGAMGMLGVDSLHDQQIVLDFKTRQLIAVPSRREAQEPGAIVVHGKFRFGQLILMDARVRGVSMFVILDSGAQNSIGNPTLRRLLTRGDQPSDQFTTTEVISVTGQTTPAEFQTVPEVTIGGLTVKNMPLAFAQLHTFDVFGMSNQPAMLLGMDILSHFRRVTIDFKRREATFTIY